MGVNYNIEFDAPDLTIHEIAKVLEEIGATHVYVDEEMREEFGDFYRFKYKELGWNYLSDYRTDREYNGEDKEEDEAEGRFLTFEISLAIPATRDTQEMRDLSFEFIEKFSHYFPFEANYNGEFIVAKAERVGEYVFVKTDYDYDFDWAVREQQAKEAKWRELAMRGFFQSKDDSSKENNQG